MTPATSWWRPINRGFVVIAQQQAHECNALQQEAQRAVSIRQTWCARNRRLSFALFLLRPVVLAALPVCAVVCPQQNGVEATNKHVGLSRHRMYQVQLNTAGSPASGSHPQDGVRTAGAASGLRSLPPSSLAAARGRIVTCVARTRPSRILATVANFSELERDLHFFGAASMLQRFH